MTNPVAAITYGCQWDDNGHVRPWPLLVTFGAIGPETTVDLMLEGRGHSHLLIDQIVALICGMTRSSTPIRLGPGRPPGLGRRLIEAGYYVELVGDD